MQERDRANDFAAIRRASLHFSEQWLAQTSRSIKFDWDDVLLVHCDDHHRPLDFPGLSFPN